MRTKNFFLIVEEGNKATVYSHANVEIAYLEKETHNDRWNVVSFPWLNADNHAVEAEELIQIAQMCEYLRYNEKS